MNLVYLCGYWLVCGLAIHYIIIIIVLHGIVKVVGWRR